MPNRNMESGRPRLDRIVANHPVKRTMHPMHVPDNIYGTDYRPITMEPPPRPVTRNSSTRERPAVGTHGLIATASSFFPQELEIPPENPKVKVVVIGDSSIGKTSMVHNFFGTRFEENVPPTALNHYLATVKSEDSPTGALDVHIWDLGGGRQDVAARRRCYENGEHNDIFLICFCVIGRYSFDNVRSFWRREILRYWDPTTSVILVGLQSEMRKHKYENGYIPAGIISHSEIKELVTKLSFSKYVECSAKMNWNVGRIFEEVARLASINKGLENMELAFKDPSSVDAKVKRGKEQAISKLKRKSSCLVQKLRKTDNKRSRDYETGYRGSTISGPHGGKFL